VKFLVDNQLPPALARFISEDLGVEAVHVADVGLRDAADADVWRHASENDVVLISALRRNLTDPSVLLGFVGDGSWFPEQP
jgi:predicted nuclease of predicted toxin-antitoxin system